MNINIIHFFVNRKNNITFVKPKQYDMEVTFEKEYLRNMYWTGKITDKKRRFQPHIIQKYILEFEEKIIENQSVATICNIIELSNHYK